MFSIFFFNYKMLGIGIDIKRLAMQNRYNFGLLQKMHFSTPHQISLRQEL